MDDSAQMEGDGKLRNRKTTWESRAKELRQRAQQALRDASGRGTADGNMKKQMLLSRAATVILGTNIMTRCNISKQ